MAYSQSRRVQTSRFQQIVDDLQTLVGKQQYYNYSPVVMRQIDQNTGIEIKGVFKTNDNSTHGEMSYVTVLRQGTYPIPHDGFGLAWRRGDGNSYNVYLVDNDAMQEEVYALHQMITQDSGINNFLIAGKRPILINTWYKFKIKILANYATRIWIVEDTIDWSSLNDSPYNSSTNAEGYIVDRGGQVASVETAAYVPISQGTYFGIGIGETKNSEWWYRDIVIASINDAYPVALFKLEAPSSYFSPGNAARIYWRGYGKCNATAPYSYGARIYVWNETNQEWELAGSNTAEESSEISDKEITYSLEDVSDYIEHDISADYINVLALTTNADETAALYTYYVRADNTFPSGIHQGGMQDIYVWAPTRVAKATVTKVVDGTGTISLTSANDFSLPIQEIYEVKESLSGNILTRNTDYQINLGATGNAWSSRSSQSLILDAGIYSGVSIDITYFYYIDGTILQTFVESDLFRNVTTDSLVKIIPPAMIEISELSYRDGPAQADLRTKVASWINNLGNDTTFEVSDLIAYLYQQGVSYVDLDNLTIYIRLYDTTGALTENTTITSSYTITENNVFACNVEYLYGIVKL